MRKEKGHEWRVNTDLEDAVISLHLPREIEVMKKHSWDLNLKPVYFMRWVECYSDNEYDILWRYPIWSLLMNQLTTLLISGAISETPTAMIR